MLLTNILKDNAEKFADTSTSFPSDVKFVKVTVCALPLIAKFCPFTSSVTAAGAFT